ncbi:hypothetical protein UFOVP152_33 [uncultured Caudovirales phage]|uniref:Uncharacterized protein n=1 Tax=uncultured Caudovirales phage TaxID=2100421 RepID=A0A6J7WBJ4_9CAUD|nr:hypothetical protein UFOVP152_33 [uncultured Caudovirales phage]
MHGNRPNVFGFLSAPTREASLHTIAKAILSVRSMGVTYKEIAKAIDVSADTIEGAASEKSLLSFDAVARLVYLFPDVTGIVCELMQPPCERPTVSDRLERIEREISAIRKEAPQ